MPLVLQKLTMPSSSSKHTEKRKRARRPAYGRQARRSRLHSPYLWRLRRLPGWPWLLGGGLVVGLYVWAFYYFFVSPFGFRWRALYGDASYPEGYEIHGIDVSHHQGDIDWAVLRNNGMIGRYPVRFVMIKATEGASNVDSRFSENFHQAREYGFVRGAYHFWSTSSSGRAQAEHFLRTVELEEGDLPPVLDVERKAKSQTPEQFKESVLTWLRLVEAHYGVKPIIYTYYKFKTAYLGDSIFDAYPYWIAHYYVDSVEYKGKWKFWQHTDCGRLPGIKGYVDFDIYNGSYYDLQQLTIGSREDEEDESWYD